MESTSKNVSSSANELLVTTQDSVSNITNINTLTSTLNEEALNLIDMTHKANTSIEEVSGTTQNLLSVVQAVENSSSEIDSSLSEINYIMNETNVSMENQTNMAGKLEKSVERFKII